MPRRRLVPKENVVRFNDNYGVLALAAVGAVSKSLNAHSANSKRNWFERLKEYCCARTESPNASISMLPSRYYDEDYSGSVFVCLDAYDFIYRLFYSHSFQINDREERK